MDPRPLRLTLAAAWASILWLAPAAVRGQADQAPPAPPPGAPAPAEAGPPAPAPAPPPSTPEAAPPPQATMEPPSPPETTAAPAPKPKPVVELPPPGPPRPIRAPVAVLQVLDKVTAETLRFEAPIGRRVRYKTIVFTVRACETRGPDDPEPRPSAYVVIESLALRAPDGSALPSKQLFKGWMSAASPSLHPLEHPVYDAWLIACGAA